MIVSPIIKFPQQGVNISDTPINIGDDQAQALDNLINSGASLESIRPPDTFSASAILTPGRTTDDILVYAKRTGLVQYLFACEGKVYYSSSKYGTRLDTGYSGTGKIQLIQFNDYVYIMDGVGSNYVWDGSNLRGMGIDAPTAAPTGNATSGLTGTDSRDYYYTYYNSTDDIESNPSPKLTISDCKLGLAGGSADIDVTASSDSQVDKIRIYRTGWGIVAPRLAKEVANTSGTYVDTSTEATVVTDQELEFDHDKPPTLNYAMVMNNRMFAWGDPSADDIVYISNEYNAEYMPILPFFDQQIIKSGGPIEIAPGSGSEIINVVPWGGAAIAFKGDNAYRIQETEIGFYGYQSMSIPGAVGPDAMSMIPEGLIYLTDTGFVLLNSSEQIEHIGDAVFNYSTNITDYDSVAAVTYKGMYIVSFINGHTWKSLTYRYGIGWYGTNDTMIGSCYFVYRSNILYAGRVDGFGGILELQIDKLGNVLGRNVHSGVDVKYKDKAREYFPSFYSRMRECRIAGETIGRIEDQSDFTLNVYDENDTLLSSTDFTIPKSGSTVVGVDNQANARYLAFEIEGRATRPIRISWVQPVVEQIGQGRSE